MPSGGLVPKIVATMKRPTRTFNLVAPVSSSFLKCLRSEFRLIGLSLRFRTTKQISSSGIPRLAITSTFFRCSSVGRNAGRPLVAITTFEYAFFRGFAHPRNHLFKPSGEQAKALRSTAGLRGTAAKQLVPPAAEPDAIDSILIPLAR